MKKIMSSLMAVAALSLVSQSAFAHGDKACAPVWKACKAAGKEGKDAHACVKTIKNGGTVDGVSVDQMAAEACQASKKGGKSTEAPAPAASSGT